MTTQKTYPQGEAPRVTIEDVNAEIVGETYTVLPSGRVTVCELTLKNGFTVRGESAVVFIENNVPQTGREVARTNAVNQIWQLLGFRLREKEPAQVQAAPASTLEPHQQRVVGEKAELDERLAKLHAFLKTGVFKSLPDEDQIMLDRQATAMSILSGILKARIARF